MSVLLFNVCLSLSLLATIIGGCMVSVPCGIISGGLMLGLQTMFVAKVVGLYPPGSRN